MVLGKHELAFGGEYVRSQLNINNLYESNGNFGITGVYSQKGPAGNSPGRGTGADANLDFLTGALNTYQQSKAQQNALRAPIPSLYVQDTYHATKRLVLSAGLRWDPGYVPVDNFYRGSIFDMSSFLSNTHSTVFPNAPAGTSTMGTRGCPMHLPRTHRGNFLRALESPLTQPDRERPYSAQVRRWFMTSRTSSPLSESTKTRPSPQPSRMSLWGFR